MYALEYIKKILRAMDYFMVLLVVSLCVFGILVIGSISGANIDPATSLVGQQQFTVVTGLMVLFAMSFVDYRLLSRFFWSIYGLNLLLLLAVWQFGPPTETGVQRGLAFEIAGMTLGLQASQFAKLFMVVFLAGYIDRYHAYLNKLWFLMLTAVLIAVPIMLVYQQPSLSASMVVLLVSLAMLFLGGLSWRYIVTALTAGVPAAVLIMLDVSRGPGNHLFVDRILLQWQIGRLYDFVDTSYVQFQTEQSVRALGSGQLTGQGLYQGIINQMNTLPEAHNDFIFAVIGEEFGFIGAHAVLIVLLIVIVKCLLTANFADTFVGRLLAAGVGAVLLFQTFIHIGVVTNTLPNTGITLPFVSFGGSSMWALMASMGIVMNVHINRPSRLRYE